MHSHFLRQSLLTTVSTIALVVAAPSVHFDGGARYLDNNTVLAGEGGEGCEGGEWGAGGYGHGDTSYPWPNEAIYGCEGDKWGEGGEGGEGGYVAVPAPDLHLPSVGTPNISKQLGGTLLGAAAGGLIGSQIGKGTGQMAAVGVGVLLGAIIGSEVGKSLDRADQLHAEETAHQSLETARTGTQSSWVNPDTGHSGTFTPTKTYQTTQGQYCREYQTTVTVAGRTESAYGTACRQPDGSWRIVG